MNSEKPLSGVPRVTIGMPVYNGSATLQHALESVVAQSYPNFRLVISDNASTDATESICRKFAAADERVTYIRQRANLGADDNFAFVLSQADTEYFMWAAADDVRSSDFIEKNIAFLDENSDFIGSTCPVRFAGDAFDSVRMGDQTRDEENPFERMLRFFQIWHANGRFYSLFRTAALRAVRSCGRRFFASDWGVVVELLAKGKLKRLDSGFVELGPRGASNSLDIFAKYRNHLLCWFLPMFEFSFTVSPLFARAPLKYRARILLTLLKVNMITFNWQITFEIKRRYRRFMLDRNSLSSAY
jgi:glycosyltransferase involved in cell wall biosynthesis